MRSSSAGPKSFLRDPFSVDYVWGNALSNSANDFLMGDYFASWAFDWANPCRPAMDRIIAGAKIYGMAALMAGGGIIARGATRLIGAGAARLLGRGSVAAVDAAAETTAIAGNKALSPGQP